MIPERRRMVRRKVPPDFVFVRGFYRETANGLIWHIWDKFPVFGTHEEYVLRRSTYEKDRPSDLMPLAIFAQMLRAKKLEFIETQHVSAAVPLVLVGNVKPGEMETDE